MTSIRASGGGRVENPQRRVIQVAAGDEPLVGFVDVGKRVGRRGEELQQGVALADLMQARAEGGDGLVMRIEQAPLGEQRVHERIAYGAFDGLAELRARDQERVDVDPIRIERQVGLFELLIVNRDQHQVDIGLGPDGVVREAAAEYGRQDRAIPFHLGDEIVERLGEFLLDGFGRLDIPSRWRPM